MWGRRLAIALWLGLAVVTWNVVFDRAVWLAAAAFTRDNVERHQRGEALPTIEAAYRPQVWQAALHASAWAAGVLVLGAVAINAAGRLHASRPAEERRGHAPS